MHRPSIPPFVLVCALAYFTLVSSVCADWITTNMGAPGVGADAEVRDHQPSSNFGPGTELATRVVNNYPAGNASDGNDRWSLFYTRFDITGQTIPADFVAAFRLTFRNTNLTSNRLQDTSTPDLSYRVGLHVFGLHPTAPVWSESTITYNNAPGLTPDGDIGDRDLNVEPFNATTNPIHPLTYVGTMTFPPIGVQNHLPVGGSVVLRSAALNTFINSVRAAGANEVTLITVLAHPGDGGVPDIRNFNYVFNPKEQTTLNADTTYDADTTDPNNPLGGPHSSASNASGAYSPAIRFDPVAVPSLDLVNVEDESADLRMGATLDGYPFHLERSYGFASWVKIKTVTGATNPITFSDELLPGDTKSFYRLTR